MNDISMASINRPIDGVGSSPVRSRYRPSPKLIRPIRSSSRYPRTRIRFGLIDVSSVVHVSRFPGEFPGESGRAIQPISKIAESRQDELLRVELSIDDRREHVYCGMR